jgi:hypothetical protein
MHVQDAKQHRWENGAALDSPVREAKLKALFLKEQATWETIVKALPLSDSPKKTPVKKDEQIILQHSRSTSCIPLDRKVSPPIRKRSMSSQESSREGARAA